MEKDETEETKEPEKEETKEPEKITSVIDSAKEQADRIEAGNVKKEELIKREEELYARKQLGGNTPAGQIPKKKSEDEKWSEEAKVRYEGTGLDPTDDDTVTTFG